MEYSDLSILRAEQARLREENARLLNVLKELRGGIVTEHKQHNGSWFCHPGCTYWHQGYHVEACRFLRGATPGGTAPLSGWQPIETVPREGGTAMLIRFPSGVAAVAYLTMPCPPMVQTWRYASGPGEGTQAPWPTHWAPLPERAEGTAL